jgi:hypothetical protein
MFEIDNFVRGHIHNPLGQPMKGGIVRYALACRDSAKRFLG